MLDLPLYVMAAAAGVALALPLLAWAVAGTRTASDRGVARNLAGSRSGDATTDLRAQILNQSATERTVQPTLAWLAARARRLTPAGRLEKLERRVVLAGRPHDWPMERVLAAKLLLGITFVLLGAFVWISQPSLLRLLFWIGAGALGFFAPDLILISRAQERQKQIKLALPDTLDQMTVCVQAGLGFEAAMARAGRSRSGPLADELIRTLQEMQVGVTRTAALKSLAARTEVPDLRQFVHAVQQAESYGIPVADILRTHADELRMRRKQYAEEQAMKIPVKVVFPLILCIMPALFVVLIGPAVIRVGRGLFGAL